MPRRVHFSLRRTRVVSCRLHPHDLDRVRYLAAKNGFQPSDFMRNVLLGNASISPPTPPPTTLEVLRNLERLQQYLQATSNIVNQTVHWPYLSKRRRFSVEEFQSFAMGILKDLAACQSLCAETLVMVRPPVVQQPQAHVHREHQV